MSAQRSIVIGGGAFAGLALALALRQGLGADIPVIVADPALALRPSRDPRATAIVAACRRLFDAIGVWDQVAADRRSRSSTWWSPIPNCEDATRPVFLTFAGNVEPGEPFAHMVENRHLIDALVKRAEAEGIELRATAVADFRFAQPGHRRDAGGRQRDRGEPAGGGRRRALEIARARRYRHPRLGLRSVRHRGHGRPRARSSRPRRRTFPPRRAVRDPAADRASARRWYGPRSAPRPRASLRSARMNFTTNWNGASGCISARSRRWISRAPFHSAISSRAPSSASGWRWSATPRM